ncbi:MAG: GNAT family N-acetyltransferase [Chloroflexi bacterium]|nr:GNAT family N-acetyltransferase [Chloroflexota bacterium]MDA1240683.1 GNAT family N-acetyltransferase [Chloroflexota bacterium]
MTIVVTTGLSVERLEQARHLLFEYMAATEVEAGRAVVAAPNDLPPSLREEQADPAAVYRAPGDLLLALDGDEAVGCAGVRMLDGTTAEVRRLFVRPGHRGGGAAGVLMSAAHALAFDAGLTKVVLDVMPSRLDVIEWYRRLGYVEVAPPAHNPYGMVFMECAVGPTTR